jgi:pyruvate/2-oxoglutarate dehydrogenase complex dihydrolipoamide acyltransferase (E2) component
MQRIWVQKVSENMADATVGQWFVPEGGPVRTGDLVVELITEKANFEIEAEEDGILLKAFAPSKSILPVGFTVAVVGPAGADVPIGYAVDNAKLLLAGQPAAAPSAVQRAALSSPGIKATPAARRRARANNLDLARVKETLKADAVINEQDVIKYLDGRTGG